MKTNVNRYGSDENMELDLSRSKRFLLGLVLEALADEARDNGSTKRFSIGRVQLKMIPTQFGWEVLEFETGVVLASKTCNARGDINLTIAGVLVDTFHLSD